MGKYYKPGAVMAPDANFYPLELSGDGFELTARLLNTHFFPIPNSRKSFKGVWASYISFEREVAKVAVTMPGEKRYQLYIHVAPAEMQVYCDCGMPGALLCKHAYYGLRNLMYYSERYSFKDLYWPGFTIKNSGKNKFLDIAPRTSDMGIRPKRAYGNLFRPGAGFERSGSLAFERQESAELLQTKANELVSGYCLAYNYSGTGAFHLPLLVPYLGITDKAGKRVSRFQEFITHEMAVSKICYTKRQLQINDICYKMYVIASSLLSISGTDQIMEGVLKEKLLKLWREAIDTGLANEAFLHTYFSGSFASLQKKPVRLLMQACNFSASVPLLSFSLKDKGDHYMLQPVLTVRRQPLECFFKKAPFFVQDKESDTLYLLRSVQDDEWLTWLSAYSNCLTVLKVHFTEFHEQFLRKLGECYPVMYQSHPSNDPVPFDIEQWAPAAGGF